MILTSDMYVPALRWRQGEYQALFRLSESVKDRVVPYITIPEVEYDFEEQRPKKTVHEHVHPFASRYKAKWGKRPAWLDVHKSIVGMSMNDGRDVFAYVFGELRAFEASAIPAISLSASANTIRSVRAIVNENKLGVALSIRLEDIMKPDPLTRILTLAKTLNASPSEIDLVFDIGAPNFEPYDAFASALISAIGKIGDLKPYRNLVLIGTSIPETFRDIAKGTDQIPRHDWMFYCALRAKVPKGGRCPNYGDYTIVHPDFTAIDMRLIKAAGKIVYTTTDSWLVTKGGAFRDNPAQMHDHCAKIVNSGIFKGAPYSYGDKYIADCAVRKAQPSNQTRWKQVTINHHITRVLDDLATLGAAP